MRAGWARSLARRNPLRRLFPPWMRRKIADLENRCAVVQSLDELMAYQLACTRCGDPTGECGHEMKEGRGVAVIDEAHEWLNSRMWDEDKALRARYVNWFSLHRHNGWDVYLISQHLDSLDKQVRDRVEYHVTLRNLRRAKLMGVPLSPVNLFLAIWVWTQTGTGRNRHVNKRQWFLLDSRRKLYSTHGSATRYDPSRPVLPRSSAQARPAGGSSADGELLDVVESTESPAVPVPATWGEA
jgi:hypothetical protein